MPVDSAATQAALTQMMERIAVASSAAVKTAALAVQAAGMKHTPVKSGTLRRSWRTESAGPFEVFVGPTMIYARRVALGFRGPDSLGRVYNQKGNPYVQDAFTETLPKIRPIFVAAIREAMEGGASRGV